MSNILYILAALLLLGILIAVHEFGHFLAARLTGIAVREFAIGFGPKLLQWTSKKHGTRFSIRLLPLGGFNSFYGEDDLTGKDDQDPRNYRLQPVWKRLVMTLVGPLMNLLLAYVVITAWLWIGGVTVVSDYPVLTQIEAGSPAEQAGLAAGDQVMAVGETSTQHLTITETTNLFAEWQPGDNPITLTVKRGEETLEVQIQSLFHDEETGRYRMGVIIGNVAIGRQKIPLWDAMRSSWHACVFYGSTIIQALREVFTTRDGVKNMMGIVGTISETSTVIRTDGWDAFFELLAIISVNLGLVNLLPIPGLDGSRVLFLLIEAVFRKPVPPEKEAAIHLVGFGLLLLRALFLTYQDIMRLIQR